MFLLSLFFSLALASSEQGLLGYEIGDKVSKDFIKVEKDLYELDNEDSVLFVETKHKKIQTMSLVKIWTTDQKLFVWQMHSETPFFNLMKEYTDAINLHENWNIAHNYEDSGEVINGFRLFLDNESDFYTFKETLNKDIYNKEFISSCWRIQNITECSFAIVVK